MVGTGSDFRKIEVIFNATTLGLGHICNNFRDLFEFLDGNPYLWACIQIKRAGRYFGSGGGGLIFFYLGVNVELTCFIVPKS